jgi:hypothetical protein
MSSSFFQSRLFVNAAILLIMALIALFVCHPLLSLAFWGDDTFLIKLAAQHTAFELLFKGPAHAINHNSFMPLLGISYSIDNLLFGLNFFGRNLHNLFWLVVAGYLTYLFLLQLGLHRLPAIAGGIALMVSPAMVSVSGHYCNRHYLFGFAFALVSLMMLLKWHKANQPKWFGGAVCFYFLAICSKEIYAPVLVIAIFLVRSLQPHIKKTFIAYSAAFTIYFILRWIMVGSFVGGYTQRIEWGTMIIYLFKSLPRLIQTTVWGNAAPSEISALAVAFGFAILLSVLCLTFATNGLKGSIFFCGLLALSLCIVAFTLYVPPVLYLTDPFYCHGDRLALAFTSSIWITFWYSSGSIMTQKKVPRFFPLLLALLIIPPLIFFGGLPTANNWKKNKITIDQVTYINNHLSEKILIIGHPTWFLRPYLALLQAKHPKPFLQAMDLSKKLESLHIEEYSTAVSLLPEQQIIRSSNPDLIQRWVEGYSFEYCRLFAERCRKQ